MLNEAQIEAAARKLCELRGIDPNDETPWGNFDRVTQKVVRLTRLQDCIEEIRAYLQVQEAVQYADETSRFCSHPMAEQMPCDCAPLTNCRKCGGSGIIQGRVEPL